MTDWRIIQGDVREVLAGMDDQSVHCIVTSPPYWGLRDYGLPALLWGGSDECEHSWAQQRQITRDRQQLKELGERLGCGGGNKHSQSAEKYNATQGQFCRLCGCWRGSLGLEPRVEMFVAHLVGIFRQVKRVLRNDGTVWLNLGSSYASANMRPSQSPEPWRVPAYGNDDTVQPDSSGIDPACRDCDDEYPIDSQTHPRRKSRNDQSLPEARLRLSQKSHDTLPTDSRQASFGVSPLGVQESTIASCTQNVQGACVHEARASDCLSGIDSSSVGALGFAHSSACISDIAELSATLAGRSLGRESSDSACGDPFCKGDCGICWAYYTIPLLKFKTKDIIPMPWLVGLALQADGWWLRSPIIWAKGLSFCETYSGSVMPESVRDRPTTSYEYLLLLTKSKSYYYDQSAVREECVEYEVQRRLREERQGLESYYGLKVDGQPHAPSPSSGARTNVKKAEYVKAGRNLRSVWAINPHPFKEAHFATFPPKLVEPCIKAGTSERGCCPECGRGWNRIVDKPKPPMELRQTPKAYGGQGVKGHGGGQPVQNWLNAHPARTLGWRPGCSCDAKHRWQQIPDTPGWECSQCGDVAADPARCGRETPSPGPCIVPALVLDPFVGSGTTVMVALRLGRRAIGIELSEAYVQISRNRIIDDCPMLNIPGEAT